MSLTMPYQSPVGPLILKSDDSGTKLSCVCFSSVEPLPEKGNPVPVLVLTARWLDRYFAGERPASEELPLAPEGTAFQRLIWKLLLKIPYGKTATYGALAREAARQMVRSRMAAQAVGGAVGRNPIGIIIPCHRVVGSDGSLTGYAWGLEKKRFLLELEAGKR